MSHPEQKPLSPERLMGMAFAYAPPLIIEAGLRHRIFDLLDNGAKSVDEIRQQNGASARALRIVMNALVGLNLLSKDDAGRYSLTPESAAFLVSSKPGYQGGLILHGSRQLIPKWLQLPEVVRTGRPAMAVNQEGPGSEFFEQFVESLFPMSYAVTQALGDELKLASSTRSIKVLDLAAGSGVWGIGLAQKSKQVRVTAVDWAGVIPVTRRMAAQHGVEQQFDYIEGDILDVSFGSGYSISTLGHILHSEGVERSKQLLRKTFDALDSGGTIAIAEWVVDEDRRGPPSALIFAVNMLVNTDEGDTFTFSEMKAWLEEAGFRDVRALTVPSPSPLILATKP